MSRMRDCERREVPRLGAAGALDRGAVRGETEEAVVRRWMRRPAEIRWSGYTSAHDASVE